MKKHIRRWRPIKISRSPNGRKSYAGNVHGARHLEYVIHLYPRRGDVRTVTMEGPDQLSGTFSTKRDAVALAEAHATILIGPA